jgi:RimJ/RimL family protein N-acetyltransferase
METGEASVIAGKRVTLRAWRAEDLPTLRRWHDDGEVMRYWGERQPLLLADRFERDMLPGGKYTIFEQSGYFCICDETGRPIGRLNYEGTDGGGGMRDRRAQLGIFIGEKDAWNKGYGPEAIIVLLNWLFNHQGWHRVWLTVQANNGRAQRVYERIGFVREGIFREHNFYDGAWHDEHIYGILAAEFNARYQPDQTDWVVDGTPR